MAVDENVAASSQNQAFSTLLLLYREVLNQELGPSDALRARKPKRLPTVTVPAVRSAGLVVTTHTVAGVLSAWAGVPVERLLDQE